MASKKKAQKKGEEMLPLSLGFLKEMAY